MNKPARLTIGLALAGGAVVLIMALRTAPPPASAAGQKRQSAMSASPVPRPLAANLKPQPLHADEEPLLPPPVIPAETPAVPPAVLQWQNMVFLGRPPEESMMSSWATRDPEGAGLWLNQNRNHPKFADLVRGYAIQIAAIDPAAARLWAAELNGSGNRFAHGGTLEQHIDAVEAMLTVPAAPPDGPPATVPAPMLLADYTPVLVRQYPDEPPVLEMRPTRNDV